MYAGEASEKGLSESRKWGVKTHIERLPEGEIGAEINRKSPFNWLEMYREEASAMERLAGDSPVEKAPKD